MSFSVLSIPAVCIYAGVFTILGSAFLFLTGVAYGLMNLGKKASREEMAEKARELDQDIDKLKLVFAEKKPATNDTNRQTPQGNVVELAFDNSSIVKFVRVFISCISSFGVLIIVDGRFYGRSDARHSFDGSFHESHVS